MNLVFDLETSGLRKEGVHAQDPSQPMPVQIGAQLFDLQWKRVGHMKHLIIPNGWSIEAEAEAVHGITEARCHRYGVRLDSALILFSDMVAKAQRIIAHNAQFDRGIITASIYRVGGQGTWWQKAGGKLFCTMETATPVCQLPGLYGTFKFPSLEEALAIVCGLSFRSTHDADLDIDATVILYRELVRRGIVAEVNPYERAA